MRRTLVTLLLVGFDVARLLNDRFSDFTTNSYSQTHCNPDIQPQRTAEFYTPTMSRFCRALCELCGAFAGRG